MTNSEAKTVFETNTTKRSSELVIDTTGLSKSFNGHPVLNSIDLKVPKNSIFGFLGPNGAGKTTAMKCLLGLIRPTSGEVKIFGKNIRQNGHDSRHRLGFLAQHPRYYDYMTAREILLFRLRFFYKGPKRLIDEKIEAALDLVGLEEVADRPIKGFSGGERQRLGIAQAQISDPDLLILDEPASALDPMGRHEVLRIMERLRDRATVFYSTHILDDVQKVSDTVAILNKGRLVAQAPIEELLKGNQGVLEIKLKGMTTDIHTKVSKLPWVNSIQQDHSRDSETWHVSVNDQELAEDQLLRLILSDKRIKVIHFGQNVVELEDIFLSLMEDA